jgi:hypothetical protein
MVCIIKPTVKHEYPTALRRRRKNWTPTIRFEAYIKGKNVHGKYFNLLTYLDFIFHL